MDVIRLFDVQNGQVMPTEHCYTINYLKNIMDKYPDNYMKIYKYLFYMTCPNPDLNPYFHMESSTKEEFILQDMEINFSMDDEDIDYALQRCNKMYETETSRAYYGLKKMMDKIAMYMYTQEIKDGRDGNGTFILNTAKNFESIRASYKGIYKDLMDEQKTQTRGGVNKAYDQ